MSLTTRAGLLAGATALTLSGVAAAATTDASTDELKAQVQKLSARVAELEAGKGEHWLTAQRSAEIRGLVQDVLADADTRASLLGSGMNAGYDNGFTIGSTDGNFLLRLNGQIQARWIVSHQRDGQDIFTFGQQVLDDLDLELEDLNAALADAAGDPDLQAQIQEEINASNAEFAQITAALAAGDLDALAEIAGVLGARAGINNTPGQFNTEGDKWRSGFEANRVKLWFSGHVVNPNWRYMIEMDLDRFGGGGFKLLDAYIQHDCGNGLNVTVGQFVLPFLREQLIDSRYQQAVERSLVHGYFTAGRSQGIMLTWDPGDFFRLSGAFSNGMNTMNNWAAYDTEWAFTGRAEVLLGGTWADFNEFRSEMGEVFGLLIGGAFHVERDEYGTAGPVFGEVQRFRATVDAMIKFGGINIFGAYIFNHVDFRDNGNVTDHGFVVQGGVHLTEQWEPFLRYEHVAWDNDRVILDDLSVLSGGVNYYFAGHQAKWTTDLGYGFKRVDIGNTQAGWRSDLGGRKGQWVLRSQLQLLF